MPTAADVKGSLLIADPNLAPRVPANVAAKVPELFATAQNLAAEVQQLETDLAEGEASDRDAASKDRVRSLVADLRSEAGAIDDLMSVPQRAQEAAAKLAVLKYRVDHAVPSGGTSGLGSGTWYGARIPFLDASDLDDPQFKLAAGGAAAPVPQGFDVSFATDVAEGDWVATDMANAGQRDFGGDAALVRSRYWVCRENPSDGWGARRISANDPLKGGIVQKVLQRLMAAGKVSQCRDTYAFPESTATGRGTHSASSPGHHGPYLPGSGFTPDQGELVSTSCDPKLAKFCERPAWGVALTQPFYRDAGDRQAHENAGRALHPSYQGYQGHQVGFDHYQLTDPDDYLSYLFLEAECLKNEAIWGCYHEHQTFWQRVQDVGQSAIDNVLQNPYVAGAAIIMTAGAAAPIAASAIYGAMPGMVAPAALAAQTAMSTKVIYDLSRGDELSDDLARMIVGGVLVPGFGPIAAILLPQQANAFLQKATAEVFYTVPGFTSLVAHAEENDRKRRELRALFVRRQQRMWNDYGLGIVVQVLTEALSLAAKILAATGIGMAVVPILKAAELAVTTYGLAYQIEMAINGAAVVKRQVEEAYATEIDALKQAVAEYEALLQQAQALEAQGATLPSEADARSALGLEAKGSGTLLAAGAAVAALLLVKS